MKISRLKVGAKIEKNHPFFPIKMDEKKLPTHSWGELYETLLEMKEKGDDPHDELFTRVFDLFPKLDKAQTLKEVRKIIDEEAWFTTMELNRINSSCLDGILNTININRTTMTLVTNYPNHLETLKFYAKRVQEDTIFSCICYYVSKSRESKSRNKVLEILLPFINDASELKKYIVFVCSVCDRENSMIIIEEQKPFWLKECVHYILHFVKENKGFLQTLKCGDANIIKCSIDYFTRNMRSERERRLAEGGNMPMRYRDLSFRNMDPFTEKSIEKPTED